MIIIKNRVSEVEYQVSNLKHSVMEVIYKMIITENRVSEELLAVWLIQRGTDGESATIEDVGVDHCRAYILMTEEFLDGSNIIAILEQVRSEGMAQGVTTDALLNCGCASRLFNRTLQRGRIKMMAAFLSTARVTGTFGGGEKILPDELARGVGILGRECIGQIDFTSPR